MTNSVAIDDAASGKAASKPTRPVVMRPFDNLDRRAAVIDAIGALDITQESAWDDLNALSRNTGIDGIDAVPEGIFELDEGRFVAAATVYVILRYGDGDDTFEDSDSFPMVVNGHFEKDGKAIIDEAEVNTASFYD